MVYTNVNIDYKNEDIYKRIKLLEAELKYYQELANERLNTLENIPEAVEKYGYVDISYNSKNIKLVLARTPGDNKVKEGE